MADNNSAKPVKVSGNEVKTKRIADQVFDTVVVPAVQDLVTNLFQTATDILMETVKTYVYGDPKYAPRNTGGIVMSGGKDYTKFSKVKTNSAPKHLGYTIKSGFTNYALTSRYAVDKLQEKMMLFVKQYGFVSVSDFYGSIEEIDTGMPPIDISFTDNKWGWYDDDVSNSKIRRIRDGWILDLPDPVPLD